MTDFSNMSNIDRKKCADFMRESLDKIDKTNPNTAVKQKVAELRRFSDALWPKDRDPLSDMQYDELQKKLHWHGTPEALETGLKELKTRHTKKDPVEIAI